MHQTNKRKNFFGSSRLGEIWFIYYSNNFCSEKKLNVGRGVAVDAPQPQQQQQNKENILNKRKFMSNFFDLINYANF
ncbi:hypothetical protein BpHYR1_030831 [Brachionus plicatilis]|uniref:Uncharacterized protein n=1 Tax=Brachionus plicatilis TaxID=10195 RepID=A0A3M7RAY7_BRAPC|nr:hypothetical protein BpHYR1_030831 [Brachionus plicatilis]